MNANPGRTLFSFALIAAVLLVSCGRTAAPRSSGTAGGTTLSRSGGSGTGGLESANGGIAFSGGNATGGRGGNLETGGMVVGSGGARTGGIAGMITTGGTGVGGTADSGITADGTSGGQLADGGIADGGTTDGGIVASDYCTGTSPKLTYLGQTLSPGATNYLSSIVMDCCNAYGVNLHTTAALGFDFQIEVIMGGVLKVGDFDTNAKTFNVRAPVRISTEAPTVALSNTSGRVRILSAPSAVETWELGLCLEVTANESALLGTRIYVPSVAMLASYKSNSRFQIYLLQDQTLRVDSLSATALESLALATSPFLDLSRIAYIEQSTMRIGLNPGPKPGEMLATQLGRPLGLPFVVLADGARIYLGTFISSVSSLGPVGPWVGVEEIKPNDFLINPPRSGADPRLDARILQVLKDTGKLVP